MKSSTSEPQSIRNEAELDDLLTRPRPILIEFVRSLPSPLVVLGAGGKMGPSLAALAKRAADVAGHKLDVIAVSRFTQSAARDWLESRGVRTVSADLMESSELKRVPDAPCVIYMVGMKFGTSDNPSLTWAINAVPPVRVMERYRNARLVALSTGNVYPMVPSNGGGAVETDELTPIGEYANSAVARERLFQYFSATYHTPVALMRLNYAVELRYGVLADIARKTWEGEPIDLTNGSFNCIWQGDANEMIIRALALASSPAQSWNLTAPEVLHVRQVANVIGELVGKPPRFSGQERGMALLNNPDKLCSLLGAPATPLDQVMRWTAQWVTKGGRSLNKPTHFEVSDGRF